VEIKEMAEVQES